MLMLHRFRLCYREISGSLVEPHFTMLILLLPSLPISSQTSIGHYIELQGNLSPEFTIVNALSTTETLTISKLLTGSGRG
ncbi:hypothetical protein K431DRAFT_140259 [Polychaeton citri CBS 116435]|uniref:Uncharacterized protein n=1 Tax=Polychaeton citri CBS 116435 TaxID=1314669 RepID=A0A9P4UJM7_9PEZI|nr:hypothetical protein K431DRAFT_140259 [Polychaeton citri CBS 116435]